MKGIVATRGFFPYLTVIFLNAFIDLGHKIVVQNTVFKVYDGNTQIMLTAVVNALILLPFILLFSPSGFISDKYPKNRVMRAAAWAALVLTLAITGCYYMGWFIPAFCLTFLLAVQSAFFSPAKYGYIKPLVGKEGLGEGNGAVQAVTIVAILMGTFAYSILFEWRYDGSLHHNERDILLAIAPIGWMLVANSLLQLFFAYRVPELEPVNREMRFDRANYVSGRDFALKLAPVWRRRVIRLSIIGLTTFWSISQVMLATFPAFAKETLEQTNTVMIQGILAASGIGIMLGSMLAGRWSRKHIEVGLVPVGALGISVGLFMISSLDSELAHFFNFMMIGMMGGFFIVPLNAMIQFHAGEKEMGKILAGNNLIQNVGMLSFLVITVVLSYLGASAVMILALLFVVASCGTLYTVWELPQSLVRFLLTYLMSRRYKVLVQGMRNIPESGGVLLLGNHISWIDWAIVQIASPRPISFVMVRAIYERWYLTWFFRMFNVIPIERGKRAQESLERVAELLDDGEVVCLFPEGQISRTGHLTIFRSGYERACRLMSGDCVIVPFYLGGLWGSQFSRASEKIKTARNRALSREIVVAFGEPLPKDTPAATLKRKVFDLSVISWHEYADVLDTLPRAWIDSVKRMGSDMAVADSLKTSFSAQRMLVRAVVLARRLNKHRGEQNIGILLPTGSAALAANMAVLLAGKTIVNLEGGGGPEPLRSSAARVGVGLVLTTSPQGVDLASIGLASIDVEEIEKSVSRVEALATMLAVRFVPGFLLKLMLCRRVANTDTAAIVFSSGHEAAPRPVMLSHKNIMANVRQLSDVLNIHTDDVVMSALPLSHALGLTMCQFLPLIEGLPAICHGNAADVTRIARVIGRYQATLYACSPAALRKLVSNERIHPLMLSSLRMVIAGQDKLDAQTSEAFKLKFHRDVFESYGVTESAYLASVNLPDQLDVRSWNVQRANKPGTVGMPLPGTSFRIVDPDSGEELPIGEAGRVLIGGCQVMAGYFDDPAGTASAVIEEGGLRWFKTSDRGFVGVDGFLTLVDRLPA